MSSQEINLLRKHELIQENMKLKRLNQNLKFNLDRLRLRLQSIETLVSHVPQSLWWIDNNGCILFINDSFFQEACQNSQLQLSEIIGKDFYELAYELGMSRHEIASMRKHDRLVLELRQSMFHEQKMTLMGNTGIYLTYKNIVFDHCQRHAGIVVIAIDITKQKQQEAILQASIQLVEKANLEKIHFLENIRHDLNSPLSNIIGAADLIKSMLQDEGTKEFLEAIIASGNHIMGLFTQLIDFFQTKHKKQQNRIQPIDINKLVSEIKDGMKMHSHNRPIEFKINIEHNVPRTILSDRTKLTRIISNLLGNAFKYTETGIVNLIIRYNDHSEHLLIEVNDSGIGITADNLERIFEPLVRLHEIHDGKYEGLGLGLSIVDQFVRDLHGSIQVKSEIGKGSSFSLTLPASKERSNPPVKVSSAKIE